MRDFEYKDIDEEGHLTLDAVATADRFNRWMYQTIGRHCQGKILEIGSGIGNISRFFLEEDRPIYLSDIRLNYRDILVDKFKQYDTLEEVLLLDLTDPHFDEKCKNLIGTFDTVFALNVVEHIKDDQLAIQNCYKLLKPGGKLVTLVPAYQSLYNKFDEELAHFRRYTQISLNQLLENNDFTVVHQQYFNFIGIFGWFFSGRILKKETIPEGQMKLYDQLVPVFKIIDKLIFNRMGLSVISVGEKR